jgi:hypothetical protein
MGGITTMPNELAKDPILPSVAAFLTYKRYVQHFELALTKTYGTKPTLGRASVRPSLHSLLSGASLGGRSNPSYATRLLGNWEWPGSRR